VADVIKEVTVDFKQWLEQQINTPDRESSAGFHFIQTFMQDPYSWYLKYVRGLKPIYTKPALTKGKILHSAIEAAYRYDADAAMQTVNAMFAASADEYEDSEQHGQDWRDAVAMIDAWTKEWLDHDKQTYHLLHIEDQFELPLANGFIITIKPDVIMQRKSDAEIRALDHKSTGRNLMSGHQALADTDQPTTYIRALKKLYPNNTIIGVESDVIFKRKNMKEAKCARPGIIQRTDWYLTQWEISTVAWLKDIARRVQMLDEGYPPAFAFPRGESHWGTSDWPDIYRAPLPEDPNEPPYGYIIDDWQRERAIAMRTLEEHDHVPNKE
jgi:hypothetical protein